MFFYSKYSSLEQEIVLQILYTEMGNRYNIFRPINSSEGGVAMDLRDVGLRIKETRET